MDVTCEHTCGSANNVSKAVVLIEEFDNIVYAVCNLVVVVDATSQNVLATLKGHAANITSVSSLKCPVGDSSFLIELITSSEDGAVFVWTRSENASEYTLKTTLQDMKSSVVSLDAVSLAGGAVICSADSKGGVNMWFRTHGGDDAYRSIYQHDTSPSQMANCLCLCIIPRNQDEEESFLLVLGGVDCRIVVKAFSSADAVGVYNAASTDSSATITDRTVGVLSGHEDWVTCLSSTEVGGELMLASGSQDSKMRVWRFSRRSGPPRSEEIESAAAAVDAADDSDEEGEGAEEGVQAIAVEEDDEEARFAFSVSEGRAWYSASLEALLVGHEDWVTSVHWVLSPDSSSWQLFSTSMDRNMLLWESEAGGVWIPTVRIGDIGGNLGGSVGANLLGFVNGVITRSGRSIIGIGFGGAFHLWQRSGQADEGETGRWFPRPFPTGHFAQVTDVSWAPDGSYLMSSSSDQTCRIHARINKKFQPRVDLFGRDSAVVQGENLVKEKPCWREVSRPQVCICQYSPFHDIILFVLMSAH